MKPSAAKRCGGKPRSRNPEQTRMRLLQAAISLFASKGYHGVSVDEIVSRARLSKRMVYHYFDNKEGLYRAALLHVYQHLETIEAASAIEAAHPVEALQNIFNTYFTFLQQNPAFVRILLWENLNAGKIIRRHHHLLSKDPILSRLNGVIQQGVRSGLFRPDIDPQHLLISMVGLCFIYHSNQHTLSQALDLDLADSTVLQTARTQSLQLLIHGLVAKSP